MAKSRKYEDRRPIGDAILEFYSALDKIEEYYTKKGYRKITMLHKVLKEELNWEMPYDTFRYHFNKEFGSKAKSRPLKADPKDEVNESISVDTDTVAQASLGETNQNQKEDEKGPTIARPNFGNYKKYNPHAHGVDPDRLL